MDNAISEVKNINVNRFGKFGYLDNSLKLNKKAKDLVLIAENYSGFHFDKFILKAIEDKWDDIVVLALQHEENHYKSVVEKAKREAIDILADNR